MTHPPMSAVSGQGSAVSETVDAPEGGSSETETDGPIEGIEAIEAMVPVDSASVEPIVVHVDAHAPSANDAEKAKSVTSAAKTRKRGLIG